ncbi:DUF7409 domain-containing protein [Haloarchaeobius sp. TZWWS8]|uniref:DUF7409 domain-containing protein n=1 Tax=Haloarchaeobius sp. TZWWS8 TaxID=3446121 RepID=UPI003EBFCAF4
MAADDGGDEATEAGDLVALDGVPEAAAAELEEAGLSPADVTEKRVSYVDLLEAGVDQEVATAIRRRYSLTWSSTLGDGLDDRAAEMGGLQRGERDWVAASTSDWEELGVPEYDPIEREPVDYWADHDRPTPVRQVVDDYVADQLRTAGITSVNQLAGVDAAALAEALEVPVMQARTWRFAARESR